MSAAVAVESTHVPLEVHASPAASYSDANPCRAVEAVRSEPEVRESYAKTLQKALLQRKDMVIDFSSLKACLDPLAEAVTERKDSGEVGLVA